VTTHPSPPPLPAEPEDDLPLRAVLTSARRRLDDRHAERAFLQATEDLTLCSVAAWERLRQNGTTAEQLLAQNQKSLFLLREALDRADILAARLAKLDARRRPHYSPELRFRILEHMRKFMLSVQDAAARFSVTPQTIYNWLDELRQHPGATTVGSTVVPVPPVRRFATAVRRLVRQMNDAGFGAKKKKKIAEILLRSAWKISPRTVGRIIEGGRKTPTPAAQATEPRTRTTTVRGDYPNHLWLADITRIPTLFPFLSIHLVAVLDAYSRLPLAVTLRLLEPSAATVIALFERATRTHGRPRHLVTDKGPQFTAEIFQAFVRAQKIKHRYGKVGESHSLGLIDRFFRTLKESLSLHSIRPWNLQDFKHRLTAALIHYSYCRPHSSLGGLTPIEKYYAIRRHLPRAVPPPHGRPHDSQPDIPFDFVFLDPEHNKFPVLVNKAA
jgi:transposase InsO family protein